jgi:hypothetical protein
MTNQRKQPHWLKVPYNNSPAAQARFHYIEKDHAAPLALEALTYDQVGTLLETYVDALHVALVLEEPSFIHTLKENPSEIRDPSFFTNTRKPPPQFIREALGDYRSATSFFRNDTVMKGQGPWQQRKQPESAGFAQAIHGQLRKAATDYGSQFELEFFPPRGSDETPPPKEDWARFKAAKAAVHELTTLQKEYANTYRQYAANYARNEARESTEQREKESARLTKFRIKKNSFSTFLESDVFQSLESRILEAIDNLVATLSPLNGGVGINRFYLHHKTSGRYIPINNNQKIDKDFGLTYPALMMLSLASKGKHDIDQTFASARIFELFSEVIGVESQITEHLQKLHNNVVLPALKQQGVIPEQDLLYDAEDRAEFVDNIRQHARGMQLLYTFHKALAQLDKIYPEGKGDIAYRDMERMLTLAEIDSPWVEELKTPAEVAAILYALGRKNHIVGKEDINPKMSLTALSQEIGKCRTFEKIKPADKTKLMEQLNDLSDTGDFAHIKQLLTSAAERMPSEPVRQERPRECGREM